MTEETTPPTYRAFDAKVIPMPGGSVEILLIHQGRDLVRTIVPKGLMPLIEKAEEIIANPPRVNCDTVGIGETVVTVLKRDPNAV